MQELFLCEFKAPPPLQACFQLHLVSPCFLHAQVDAGRIFVAPKVEVGYLEQTAVSGSERTVWEEARSRMTALIAAEMAMEFAAAEAEKGECRCFLQPAGPSNCQGSGNSATEEWIDQSSQGQSRTLHRVSVLGSSMCWRIKHGW